MPETTVTDINSVKSHCRSIFYSVHISVSLDFEIGYNSVVTSLNKFLFVERSIQLELYIATGFCLELPSRLFLCRS